MDATTKNRLTAAIAKWVATECRPVSVVEDEGLADIIRIASNDWTYELPSSATVTSHVQSLRETERAKVQQALDKTNAVALTGDCWTSLSTHHYLGVTAHYLGPRWELRSHALTVVKTEERHSADAVAEHFLRVAREWDVEHKVVSLTTDGTRHMTAAARQLPFEHTPCVAHAVHRAVAVSLTDGPFDGALAACRKVVGHFRHSPARQAELERQQVAHRQKTESLAQEVSTRWNSTLEMIQGVQRNAGPLRDALGPHTAHHVAMPTATELEILKRLEAVLEHCRYVSELLGGEEFVSCSVVLPALCHLSRVMEVTEDEPAYMIKFKGTFTADMEGCKEKTNITWLRVATALDPRFKDLKCLSKPDRAEVWGTIRTLLRELERERPAQPDNQVTEPPTKKPTLMLAHESSSDEEEDRIELCLERYKAEPLTGMDDCPQEWWSTHEAAHGEMARLARKYLATPATSVPSERLFSLSGHVVQKKRASLLSENVNSLVCLSNWLKAKK